MSLSPIAPLPKAPSGALSTPIPVSRALSSPIPVSRTVSGSLPIPLTKTPPYSAHVIKPLALHPLHLFTPSPPKFISEPKKQVRSTIEKLPTELLDNIFLWVRNPSVFATCKIFYAHRRAFYEDYFAELAKQRPLIAYITEMQSVSSKIEESVKLLTKYPEEYYLLSDKYKEKIQQFFAVNDWKGLRAFLLNWPEKEKRGSSKIHAGLMLITTCAGVLPRLMARISNTMQYLLDDSSLPFTKSLQKQVKQHCQDLTRLGSKESSASHIAHDIYLYLQRMGSKTLIFPLIKRMSSLAQDQVARALQDWALINFTEAMSNDVPCLDEFWTESVDLFNDMLERGTLRQRQDMIHVMAADLLRLFIKNPDQFAKCKKIAITDRDLTLLSCQVFTYFTGLEELSLIKTKLFEVPATLSHCKNLSKLTLSNNFIRLLPPAFSQLTGLVEVELEGNELFSFPGVLCDLPRVRYLGVGKNKLSELPDELEAMKELRLLNLADNQFCAIPSVIEKSSVQVVDLKRNKIDNVENWHALRHLIGLNLSGNTIPELPKEIGGCSHLEVFDITHNKIEEISDEIRLCSSLRDLRLEDNPLYDLPSSILGEMPALTTLGLDQSQKRLLTQEALREFLRRELITPLRSDSGFEPLDVFRTFSPPPQL